MATDKVLLVDDSGTIRALVKVFLVGLGLEYQEACSGSEALTLARQHRPALIILDVRMPEMDGLQFCEALRAEPDPMVRSARVILLTAVRDAKLTEQATALGVYHLMSKPINGAELISVVRDAMGSREVKQDRAALRS